MFASEKQRGYHLPKYFFVKTLGQIWRSMGRMLRNF